MGVRYAYTREVSLLNDIEAKSLFKSLLGDNRVTEEYKTVTNRLLSKCGGLPLAIVVIANALKDRDLPYWRKFADDLEKPISSPLHSTYLVLATSYGYMESKEKRMFFLLCCLLSHDTRIYIKDVVRCSIGLDLFQHVNKLSEAMDQADRWADELIVSSMLLKSDSQGFLKIHDVVRAFGISVAAKDDGHKLLADAIPQWMNKETLKEYTAISLLSDNDYSGLTGMESDKLQILLLEHTEIPDSPSSFSGRMMNLTVLYLGNMNFHPKLPESVGKLVKLRTLSLEYCKLGDIKVIGELVNLCVVSFLGSDLEELPNEIGKLINLRLLDLTDCIFKFRPDPANILGGLSQLEGLFMFDIFKRHAKFSYMDGAISYTPPAIEFNNMPYLNALEMCMWSVEQLSVDAHFVKNLDTFRIYVNYKNDDRIEAPEVGSYLRILDVNEVDVGKHLGDNTLKALLKKADWLQLRNTSKLSILFDKLGNSEALPELRHLEVGNCEDVAFIFKLRENLLVFPKLHFLKLRYLLEIERFCDEETLPGIFSNVRDLRITHMENLQYVLPFGHAPCKLTSLYVGWSESVKFIFTENASADKEEKDVMELPFLKSLDLSYLSNLVSLLGSENLSGIDDGVQEHQVFFNPRIVFPALDRFSLLNCNRILKLWDKELGISSLQHLTTIKIGNCEELSCLGSLSLFSTLVQLENLKIEMCDSMHKVISAEGTQELEERDQVVIFPRLKDLVIRHSSNLKSFYGGRCKLKFPNLKILVLFDLGSLTKFTGSENQSVLFHKEMEFPRLEVLEVSYVNDKVMGLWDWHLEGGSTPLSNPVPMLKKLIRNCKPTNLEFKSDLL